MNGLRDVQRRVGREIGDGMKTLDVRIRGAVVSGEVVMVTSSLICFLKEVEEECRKLGKTDAVAVCSSLAVAMIKWEKGMRED